MVPGRVCERGEIIAICKAFEKDEGLVGCVKGCFSERRCGGGEKLARYIDM